MSDIIRTKRFRSMIGWLGMILPWLAVLLQLFNDIFKWPPSISATWYTNACTPFMIILGAAGLLLICYHGYDKTDDILNTLAGIMALGICLFPCKAAYVPEGCISWEPVGTFLIPMVVSSWIHNICAIGFFVILAYISIFQFTKGDSGTRNKRIRNVIFRVCGIGMVASFLIFLLPKFYIRVWLIEAIALFFFGVSWLTKANKYKILFRD